MKYRATAYLFAVLLAFIGSSQVHAAIIHESATLGTTGVGPSPDPFGERILSSTHFLGSRFSTTSPTQVTAIGGHIVDTRVQGPPGPPVPVTGSSDNIFGAIVMLSGPSADPSFDPADIGVPNNTLAHTTLTLPASSDDVRVPLSILLAPGDYALIFGSAHLPYAGGQGQMPFNNTLPPPFPFPNPSLFQGIIPGGPSFWTDSFIGGVPPLYFVVEGTVVPLPPAFGLFAAGLIALGFIVLRGKRAY